MSLLPEVREELVATAARRAAARAPRWRQRTTGGAVAVALGVACAVAVVIVGVVALRHRAPAPAPTDTNGGSGVAAFETKLAILRRPQTPADRTYPNYTVVGRRIGTDVITDETRLATTIRTPQDGLVRVYVVVRKLPPRKSQGDFIGVESFDRHGVPQGGTPVLTASELAPSVVGTGRIAGPRRGNPNAGVDVGLVPDGVTRVKWTFTGARFGILHPRAVTLFPVVHGNVAVAPVRPGQGPLAAAVWYGADGRVIASGGPGADGIAQLKLINSVNASRQRPVAPLLIAHYSLFRTVPPENLARDSVLPTTGEGDLNYWQTRYIPSLTGLDGPGLWLTPGEHDLCMSDPQASVCGWPKTIDSTGFIGGGTYGNGEMTLEGLVPDGNRTVTMVLADGTRRAFPVIDNAYEATVKGRVVAIIDRSIQGHIVRHALQ